jgi:hypothetical protein
MCEWERDLHEGTRRENWSLRGPMRIVKVLPGIATPAAVLGGYITQGKFLVGKTPDEIEAALGLPADFLKAGATIYSFKRVPLTSEYEYELTAKYPDGLAWNPAHFDERYRPGHPAIHQWRIKPGILIPVEQSGFLTLSPGRKFPYAWLV